MLECFKSLNPTVQAAIISGCAAIIGTIIAGVFSLIKRGKGKQSRTIIKQKQGFGNKGTQVGIQNNTVKFGNTTVEGGTIIIDGGNAMGGGEIRFEPASNNGSFRENKNE